MKRHQEATMQSQSPTLRELAIPFAIYLVICTLTLSRVPSITTDSINYINSIDSACCWFHPHHLLYGPVAWAWVAICKSLGIRIDSDLLVSELNTIFGALSLCAFYSIVRCRLGSDRWTAVLVTGLPAFSWGLRYYSGCVEVYVIPLFCLLLSLFLLSAEHLDGRTFAFAGFLNEIAVALAELSVLFVVVVLFAAWYGHQRGDGRLTKSLTIYVSAALPTVALPYLWALSSLHRVTSFETALRWLTDYGHYSRFWSPLSASSVFKAGVGLGQAFIGSHFVFALPLFRSWVEIKLREVYLINDIYLVRNLGAAVARFLVALSIALCLIVLFSGGFSIFSWPELSSQKQRLICLSLVWVLAYGYSPSFTPRSTPSIG